MLISNLMQASRNRQQGFAGAGFTHKGDEFHRWIQQQIEGKVLFAVAWL